MLDRFTRVLWLVCAFSISCRICMRQPSLSRVRRCSGRQWRDILATVLEEIYADDRGRAGQLWPAWTREELDAYGRGRTSSFPTRPQWQEGSNLVIREEERARRCPPIVRRTALCGSLPC